jgi:HTH-type transcriptional regulator/antitoxin HigA
MTKHTVKEPDFDFAPHPGRLLQRELDARLLTQAQLALRTGLSTKHINLVVKGAASVSPDVAVTLEQVLGTPADTWLHLEAAYQAEQARTERRSVTADFVSWAAAFPRPLLMQRGVINAEDTGSALVAKLLAFFQVASPKTYEDTWLVPQASYKRSQVHPVDANLTALWLRLAEIQAQPYVSRVKEYDAKALDKVARSLPQLTLKDARTAFLDAQAALLDAGVILVFVPEVPGTRISGVSRRINGTPMIAVTSRYKTLDGLWFTILHEIAHIVMHPKRSTFIDEGRVNDDDDMHETAANRYAQDVLIPAAYKSELLGISSRRDVVSLAQRLKVSPSLIAGQWAHLRNIWGGPIASLRVQVDLDKIMGDAGDLARDH